MNARNEITRGIAAASGVKFETSKSASEYSANAGAPSGGDALDDAAPLARSEEAICKAAAKLQELLCANAKQIRSNCGVEQEFFLIDKQWRDMRPDLLLAGRTLAGAPSQKDYAPAYHRAEPAGERIQNYMHNVSAEAFKLGIPVAIRHGAAAPGQYKFAPICERAAVAASRNLQLMDIMKKIAPRHGLVCLLHEKPFAGVNGSGKHISWSLTDDGGGNLLNPGGAPEENLIFLTTLASVIHAVHKHGALLRGAAANAGNERRLNAGADDATSASAIMSVSLGEDLSRIIAMIESGKIGADKNGAAKNGGDKNAAGKNAINENTAAKNTADKNIFAAGRASPFAFTGEAFEFRALGSSMNVSTVVTILNTIVADSMNVIVERVQKELKKSHVNNIDNNTANKSSDKTDGDKSVSAPSEKSAHKKSDNHNTQTPPAAAVLKVLASVVKESKNILFDGDCRSREWINEAARRGLPGAVSAPEALKIFTRSETADLFARHNVFSKDDLDARYAMRIDNYIKTLDIEARTLSEMARTQILPCAYNYQADIAGGLELLRVLSDDMTINMVEGALEDRKEAFEKLTADIFYVRKNLRALDDLMKKSANLNADERAAFMASDIIPHLDHVRRHVNELEFSMPDEAWPLPKYREMLFVV